MGKHHDIAHSFVARWEGGYSDHPDDKGGPTNYGVDMAMLKDIAASQDGRDVLHRMGVRLPVNRECIKMLTPDLAKTIYRWQCWDKLRCDELPLAVAVFVYDSAVNHGNTRAVLFAQQTVNRLHDKIELTPDGILGTLTRAALARDAGATLCSALCATREAFFRRIVAMNPRQGIFLQGWLNRVHALDSYIRGLL